MPEVVVFRMCEIREFNISAFFSEPIVTWPFSLLTINDVWNQYIPNDFRRKKNDYEIFKTTTKKYSESRRSHVRNAIFFFIKGSSLSHSRCLAPRQHYTIFTSTSQKPWAIKRLSRRAAYNKKTQASNHHKNVVARGFSLRAIFSSHAQPRRQTPEGVGCFVSACAQHTHAYIHTALRARARIF